MLFKSTSITVYITYRSVPLLSVFYFNFFDFYNEWHRLIEQDNITDILIVSFEAMLKVNILIFLII